MKPIIELKNISKHFVITHQRENSLKGTLLDSWKKKTHEVFYALKDVSFSINPGEFVGIIGRNGSGKSTLLKILAGVYVPDSGKVSIHGKISPFLELGVGFNGELNGRENVYLYGAVLGLSKKQIDDKYNEIVSFAELEKFMDTKMKHYSSGMYVRLAFSIAIQADAPILLVDEALAVGDANFQQKCFDVFERFKKEGKTVVLVSHDLATIRKFCDKAALLKEGKLMGLGKTNTIVDKYLYSYKEKTAEIDNKLNKPKKIKSWGNKKIKIESVKFINKKGHESNTFLTKERLEIRITLKSEDKIKDSIIGMIIYDENNNYCFGTSTELRGIKMPEVYGEKEIKLFIPSIPFGEGKYFVTVAIQSGKHENYDWHDKMYSFNVKNIGADLGKVIADLDWAVK